MNTILKYSKFFIISILILTGCSGVENMKEHQVTLTSNKTIDTLLLIYQRLSQNPESNVLYYQKSKYFFEKKDFPQALQDINKSISLDSSFSAAYILKGEILSGSDKYMEAEQAFKKALVIDKKNITALLKLAWLSFYKKDYTTSFKYLNNILKTDIYHAEPYFLKGLIYKETGDTAKSISSFQTCIEQDKKYYNGYIQLGLIFLYKKAKNDEEKNKNYRLASAYFSSAISNDSLNTEAYYARGMCYQDHQYFAMAIKDYKKIISIDSSYYNAYYNLGFIYYLLDSIDKAFRYFEMTIGKAPDYAEAYYNRALCYEAMGNIEQAKNDINRAVKLNPGMEQAKIKLAEFFDK